MNLSKSAFKDRVKMVSVAEINREEKQENLIMAEFLFRDSIFMLLFKPVNESILSPITLMHTSFSTEEIEVSRCPMCYQSYGKNDEGDSNCNGFSLLEEKHVEAVVELMEEHLLNEKKEG